MNTNRTIALSFLAACVIAIVGEGRSSAQNLSVSTNVVDWAEFATMNIEAGLPLARHLSVHAGVRVNPWQFGIKAGDASYAEVMDLEKAGFFLKKTQVGLSLRWWPWHVFSGWWFRAKAQYSSYDRGGKFLGQERYMGDAVGGGLALGYTWMLSSSWNLELGVGGWAGMTRESVRENIVTPTPTPYVWKPFVLPDDLVIAFVYIF